MNVETEQDAIMYSQMEITALFDTPQMAIHHHFTRIGKNVFSFVRETHDGRIEISTRPIQYNSSTIQTRTIVLSSDR